MEPTKAFAPGNISCIFVIKKSKNPAKSGSLGLGFTINKGVIVTIKNLDNNGNKKTINKIKKSNNKRDENIIYFNGKKIDFPTVDSVIKKLTKEKVVVKIKSELPLGSGFGISGASALATAYALNKLLRLGKSKKELAFIAHIAEVENSTGLGDVVNQYYGGFLLKEKPSYMFKVRKIPIKNKAVYYKFISRMDTKKIISNKKIKDKVNKAGTESLKKLKSLKGPGLKEIIQISKKFSIESGLLKNKKTKRMIEDIEKNNGNASMIMLGNAVFSDKSFKGSKKIIIKDKVACTLN